MFAALGAHGGYGNMIAQLEAVSTSLPKDYTTVINGDKSISLLWALLPMIMYYWIGQDVYQRLFACKTEQIARKTAYISGILLALLGIPPVIIGMVARLDFPELATSGNTASAFASVAIKYLPGFAVGIVLAAIFAAILSTADSILTAATSHFMNDIWVRYVDKNTDPESKKLLRVSRIVSLLMGISAVLVSLYIPEVITLQIYAYTLYTAGAFVPIVLGVMWKKTTKEGAIAGLLVGAALAAAGLTGFQIGAIPGELFSAVIAAAVTVVVSLAGPGKQTV
jgi:SSS family solute:Na+ symporter